MGFKMTTFPTVSSDAMTPSKMLLSYPPFAMTVCVPIITLLTLDIIANTAESVMTVVSIPTLAKLVAIS